MKFTRDDVEIEKGTTTEQNIPEHDDVSDHSSSKDIPPETANLLTKGLINRAKLYVNTR